MDSHEFQQLLEHVADGWSRGEPRSAAEAFAEDAVYVEPPERQRYVGREALYAFFHGEGSGPRPMAMIWHAVAFDTASQTGFGEYTFSRPGREKHGCAVVAVRHGLIASWREYQYESDQRFEDFAGDSLVE